MQDDPRRQGDIIPVYITIHGCGFSAGWIPHGKVLPMSLPLNLGEVDIWDLFGLIVYDKTVSDE